MADRFIVENNGADSTVINTTTGVIVFSGPYDRAVSQAAELNRQSSSAYNQKTVVSTAATANTNPSDDNSRASQTNSDSTTAPLNSQELANLTGQQTALAATVNALKSSPDSIKATAEYKNTLAQRENQLADVTKKINALQVGGNQEKTIEPTDNPLDKYASYTYNITLHMLSSADYNKMIKNPKGFVPTKTLISSAGRYRNTYTAKDKNTGESATAGRDPAFNQDFYFDNLKFETIIGLNAHTRGTNALAIEFTIIEPYGMTLLDRIMDVNNLHLNSKNYLEMPYLLEITFFGSDDNGKQTKITNQTKWIPIKLIGFKITAGVKGAEYHVSAVPFNHGAYFETVQSVKTRMEVTSKTVGEYFSSSLDTATQNSVNSAIEEDSKRQTQQNAQTLQIASGSASYAQEAKDKAIRTAAENPITVNAKSFVAAYNAWFAAQEKKGNIEHADVIQFNFIEDDSTKQISSSSIVDAKKNSIRRVGETDTSTKAKSDQGNNTNSVKFDSIVHDLEAGTSINEVINIVLSQSEYFLKQVKDTSTDTPATSKSEDDAATQTQSTPVKMWKIVPTIELLDFDTKRNVFAKRITFNVSTYLAYQKRDDRLPQSNPPKAVKRYDYLYTGKNSNVISFDIDFNALYYTALSTNRNNVNIASGASQVSEDKQDNDKVSKLTDKRQIAQETRHPVTGDQSVGAGGAAARSETQNSRSALQGIYTSAAGDMINLKLQIIGDPEFIKQDDFYVSPAISVGSGTGIIKSPNDVYVPGTSSISMDSGEIFCYVTFRTPTDFNDSTGMYDLNSKNKYSVSEFSGHYKVINVTNEFRNGKFTQTLNLIRYPKQDPINKSSASSSDVASDGQNQREGTSANQLAKQQAANPAVSSKNTQTVSDAETPPSNTTASRGADGDAAVTTSTASDEFKSPLAINKPEFAPPTALADVASAGRTIAIGDETA